MRRQLAAAHREPAFLEVHVHQRAVWEVLPLDFRWGPRVLAPFDRASDDATGAHSRLVVIQLRRRSPEWAAGGAVDDRGGKAELRQTLLRRPSQDLARTEWLHAGRASRRLHRRPGRLRRRPHQEVLFDAALAVYIWPQPSSVAAGGVGAAYGAHYVAGDATFHPLFLETLLQGPRVKFDAGESLGQAWSRDALRG